MKYVSKAMRTEQNLGDEKLGFHAGRIVARALERIAMPKAELLRRMGLSPSTRKTFIQENIGTDFILRASEASGINLFEELSAAYREQKGEEPGKMAEIKASLEMVKGGLERIGELVQL